MILYKTVAEDAEGKNVERWDGTEADARATRKDYKARDFSLIETEKTDVPTHKAGLMAFLNKFDLVKKG
jgi:hypothetical protein